MAEDNVNEFTYKNKTYKVIKDNQFFYAVSDIFSTYDYCDMSVESCKRRAECCIDELLNKSIEDIDELLVLLKKYLIVFDQHGYFIEVNNSAGKLLIERFLKEK